MNKKGILLSIVAILFAGLVLNINVSIRQGIDGHYRQIKMPLYVKWIEFLGRHYEYARIAKEITAPYERGEEKVLAILKWTHENIRALPENMPTVDDHILNIMIRGYGVPEQYQDVFTTLCAYSGIPSFWNKFYDKSHKARYGIAVVKINGRWCVFDAYYGRYFTNDKGEIASVEDILKNNSLVKGEGIDDIYINGIPYRSYYYNLNLKPVIESKTLRPQKQMPLPRIVFEAKKLFGIEKEEPEEGH